MLNELGGLAGGLVQGMNMGMQWRNMQQHQERLTKADARDAEIHDLRKDQYASEKDLRDRRNNTYAQIAEYTKNLTGGNQAAPAQPAPMQDPNAQTQQAGLAPDTRMAGTQPLGGLTGAQPEQPQQEQIKPSKILERGMVTGMYTPKALTDIAGIFAQNGLHEEGIKYMNQAYEFEKRGGVRAGMALMQNNPGLAAEAFKGSGIDLEGLPVKVNPDDPNDMNWKINIKGQGEKTINARDVIQSNMDPEKFFEREDKLRKEEREAAMDKRKQDNVERKTDAEIGFYRSRSQLAEARAENPGGLKSSRSSDKSIEQAISRRDKRFDLKATTNEDGIDRIDPELRGAYDDTAVQLQSIIEDETGEELDHRQHHKLTDEILRFPVDGTPQQKATATAALLRRFKLDVPEAKQESKTASLGKPAPGKISQAAALKPKKEPTREEQELKSLESNRNYPTLITDLKKLQKERYASNLNEKQKAEVEAKIKTILDSDKPKGSLK